MNRYNHFNYAKHLAAKLKAIQHTKDKPHYFEAFGIEDLYSLDDKLSSVTGFILIAIDGYNFKGGVNASDALFLSPSYSYIIAKNAISDRPETINQASEESIQIMRQILSQLLQDFEKYPSSSMEKDFEINGIGPIGDNFYGVMLSFSVANSEGYTIDTSFWEE